MTDGKNGFRSESSSKKWEVSISEYETSDGIRWKVTRRVPAMSVAETKIFSVKREAIKQYEEWLS